MTESLKSQRPITNLTPLSPKTCLTYTPEFKYMNFFGDNSNDLFHSEIKIAREFEEENCPLYDAIQLRANSMQIDGNFSIEYMRGARIAYRFIKAEAKLRGGIPALITDNNLERYERDLYGDHNYEYLRGLKAEGKDYQVFSLENKLFMKKRPTLVAQLEKQEPYFINTIRMNLRTIMEMRLESVIDGAIDTYFPFWLRQDVKKVRRIVRQNGF